MCYEFWRNEQMSAEQKAAKQRAEELIDRARSAMPVPKHDAPVTAEKEMEQEGTAA
jgi:hypothetical protein